MTSKIAVYFEENWMAMLTKNCMTKIANRSSDFINCIHVYVHFYDFQSRSLHTSVVNCQYNIHTHITTSFLNSGCNAAKLYFAL